MGMVQGLGGQVRRMGRQQGQQQGRGGRDLPPVQQHARQPGGVGHQHGVDAVEDENVVSLHALDG